MSSCRYRSRRGRSAAARSADATIISSTHPVLRSWLKPAGFWNGPKFFNHRYGTPRLPVEKALRSGRDVLFDIDWQGTQQLREKARDDLVSVFILPPTAKELERRLKRRAQDSHDIISGRMAKAAGEMSHWPEYDYVIVNRDIDKAFAEVRAILGAERLKRERQIGLSGFVRDLQANL